MIYTRPEFRRRGLTRVAQIAVARDLVARGFRGSFATESPANHASIIAADRKGSRRIGTVTRTCLVKGGHLPADRRDPDLVVNGKAATALGLVVPPGLLVRPPTARAI